MPRLIVFHRRRDEVALDDWQAVWRGAYADGLLALPGHPRVTLNVPAPGQSDAADGIDEIEWDDEAAAREAVRGPWLRYLIERVTSLQAEGWPRGALFADRVLAPPPPSGAGAKRMGVIGRRADLDPATFDRRWREEHGPLVLALPELRGYVQAVVIQLVVGLAPADGVAVLWFASREAAARAFAGAAGQAAHADAGHLMDPARVVVTHVDEVQASIAGAHRLPAETAGWRNWSGSVRCRPRRIATPRDEAEVVEAIHWAGRERLVVRVAGTGHSFTPLCASDGLLLSLDGLTGLASVSPEAREATVWGGTTIHDLGPLLHAHGLAMENMGDIDRQTIAGAVSTGTHGTGRSLGNISTQVIGLRLVTASGEIVDCSASREAELFDAARVSLGALGVITQVRLRLLPAFRLLDMRWDWPFDRCMTALTRMIADNHHFEFFWNPRTDLCAMKSLNPTAREPGEPAPGQRVDWSHRIFPSERTFRFNEMEFALSAEHGPACMREVRDLMRERHPDVAWPIEYRTLAPDDIPLSPASGRDTVTISVHQAAQLDHRPFFGDVETIFRRHDGRPHWGKMHTHRAPELAALYPGWERFQSARRRIDPHGRFLNPHLREILEAP